MSISRFVAWTGVLAAVALAGPSLNAAPDARPAEAIVPARVSSGTGVLAVASKEEGPWRILDEGRALPAEDCFLKTAGSGASRIDLAGTVLVLWEQSYVRLRMNAREVYLVAGRAQIETDDRPWIVRQGERSIEVSPKSAAEFRVDGQAGSVGVTRGTVLRKSLEEARQALGAGMQLAWSQADDAGKPGTISPRELAAASIPPLSQGLGQLVVPDDAAGPTRLNVSHFRANVVLDAPLALVQIDQAFFNHFPDRKEGTYVFNLPPGASVCRFAMYVTSERLIEGEMIEREQASSIYESIVRSMRDPAILEKIGDNLFKMRVFPIFPHEHKRILLEYTVPLPREDGMCHFRLPLASDLEEVWDFRLSGHIRGVSHLAKVASPSHAGIRFQPMGADACSFEYVQSSYGSRNDLLIHFPSQLGSEAIVRRSSPAVPVGKERPTYFLATIPAEKAEVAKREPVDLVFLCDTSLSSKLATLRGLVRTAAGQLGPDDRFQILCVDSAARPLGEWARPHSPEHNAALARLGQEFSLGSTNLEAGFREAAARLEARPAGRRRAVLYLGDGKQNRGSLASVIDRLGELNIRVSAALVGSNPLDLAVLPELVRATGGRTFQPDIDRGRELFAWGCEGFAIADRIVSVTAVGLEPGDVFFPSAVSPGQPLEILGRVAEARDLTLTITRERGGKSATETVPLALSKSAEDPLVGRQWAERRMNACRADAARAPATAAATRREIVELSQRWSLLSPYTAFLVLETEQDYQRWNIVRGLRHRYGEMATTPLREPPRAWTEAVAAKSHQRLLAKQGKKSPAAPIAQADRPVQASRPAQEIPDEELALLSSKVRDALRRYDAMAAQVLIQTARQKYPFTRRAALKELEEQAAAAARREAVFGSLGRWRGMFDPAQRGREAEPPVTPAPLLTAAFDAEFLKIHPHAEQLSRRVQLNDQEMSLADFAKSLESWTGVNVTVDRRALEDEGVDVNETRVRVESLNGRSLRHVIADALKPRQLIVLDETHRLMLTTQVKAEEHQKAYVYSIADLFANARTRPRPFLTPRPETADDSPTVLRPSLSDPYSDVDQAAEERIRARLRKPVTLGFNETPLVDVVEAIADMIGDNVRIDRRALEDEGVDTAAPVTATWRNVPLEKSLEWILDPLGLDFEIKGEALQITTKIDMEEQLTTRLHSVRGLVTAPVPRQMNGLGNFAMGGGGGGGGGFFGGGGGGMGGGFFMGGGGNGGGGFFPGAGAGGGMSNTGGGVSLGGDGTPHPATSVEPEPDPESDPQLIIQQEQVPHPAVPEIPGFPIDGGTRQNPGGGIQSDYDSAIDLITSSEAPQSWDEVGGRGAILPWYPTSELVVTQTERTHNRIERLLNDLRKARGLLAAPPADIPAQPLVEGDYDTLIQILTSSVRPQAWDEVGGRCSINPSGAAQALVISADPETHQGVHQLLTQLRRSQAALGHRKAPVSAGGKVSRYWEILGGAPLPITPAAAEEEARAEELEALAARLDPTDGAWRYVRQDLEGRPIDEIIVQRSPGRLELAWPSRAVRLEKAQAAVAYPGLTLVEQGPWADAFRTLADGQLPGWPHRSNDELARMFEVRRVPSKEDKGAEKKDPQEIELEFVVRTSREVLVEEPAVLRGVFDVKTRLPRSIVAFAAGKPVLRISFEDLTLGPVPSWRTMIVSDGDHKKLEIWRIEPVPDAAPLPTLAESWPKFARLGGPAETASLAQVLEAIRARDWRLANRTLAPHLARQPEQPFLRLLRAWCHEHERSLGGHEQALADLRAVAEGSPAELAMLVLERAWGFASPRERLQIALLVPERYRSAEACLRIVELAAVESPEAAIDTITQGLNRQANEFTRWQLELARIEILLDRGKHEEAGALALARSKDGRNSTAQAMQLADRLAQAGVVKPALEILALAARGKLTPQERLALCRQHAALHEGAKRWRILVSAIQALPASSKDREVELRNLLDEMRIKDDDEDAQVAGLLAAETTDDRVRRELLERQAELTLDAPRGSELYWKLYQEDAKRAGVAPPPVDLPRACLMFQASGHHDRVVAVVEAELRSGRDVTPTLLGTLARAYLAVGRHRDADRANGTE